MPNIYPGGEGDDAGVPWEGPRVRCGPCRTLSTCLASPTGFDWSGSEVLVEASLAGR